MATKGTKSKITSRPLRASRGTKPETVRKTRRAPLSVAPFPDNVDHATRPAGNPLQPRAVFRVQGPMSTFGGPKDTGMSPSEGLALFEREDLQDPRFRELFLPSQPSGTSGLGRRLDPDKFYVACRWDYNVTSRSFLRNAVALVQSVRTGQVEKARPVDWRPNARTGRVADLSPRLATALQLDTDDEVIVTIRGNNADFVTRAAAAAFNGPSGTTEPKIFTTSEWGAAPANVAHFPENTAAGIVVHNTQTQNRNPLRGDAEFAAAREVARRIQHDHMTANRWEDTGQHFTISRGGLILEGRHGSLVAARAGRVVKAAHAKSRDGSANLTWFGIELEGDNRQADLVTKPQYSALVELCAWLNKWCGRRDLPIKGHMDVLAGHTDCPGHFEERLPILRQNVAARRAQLG
jgi:N-acetylmuramoyl-L-alanine amidase